MRTTRASAPAPEKRAAYRTGARLPKCDAPSAAETPALAAQAELPDALELSKVAKTTIMFKAGPNVGRNRTLQRAAMQWSG
jgi:hypothetical protein